jgi:hypothetical protein
LYQIIDNHNILSPRVAMLNDDGSRIAQSPSFSANDNFHVAHELRRKALGGAVVGEGNAINVRISNSFLEEGNGCLEGSDGVAVLEK